MLLKSAKQRRMVTDEEGHEQCGHQGRGVPGRLDGNATEDPHGDRSEVEDHLGLGELLGADPDDRQHAEEAKTDAGADLGVGKCGGHRHHTDVDAQQCHDHVAPLVAREIQPEGQQ